MLGSFAQLAFAADRHVPADYPTIQAAIDACSNGDTVVVASGTRHESGIYLGPGDSRKISIRSATGDPADCIVDCGGGKGFWVGGTDLSGITVTHAGAWDGTYSAAIVEGGVMTNCRVVDNYTGGVHALAGYGSMTGCTFRGNGGWGVFTEGGYEGGYSFDSCTFDANALGGAFCVNDMYVLPWPVYSINNCTFTNEPTSSDVYEVYYTDCTFSGNVVGITGGEWLYLTRCKLNDNQTAATVNSNGGGLIMQDSQIIHNGTGFVGSLGSLFYVGNSIFMGNAGWAADGLWSDCKIYQSIFAGNGGGFRTAGDPFQFRADFCTVTGNTEGGILIYNPQYFDPDSDSVRTSILWGNGNIDFTGGYGLISDIGTTDAPLTDCISADPLFVRNPSPGPDGVWGTADDDYGDLHLQRGSPCIDRCGIVGGTDLDGNPRTVGAQADMGAYESPYVLATANAGPDQTVTVSHDGDPATNTASFTLDGSGSVGNSLSYQWSEAGTLLGTTAGLTLSRTAGIYTFTLKVTDSFGDSSTDEVQVTVLPEPNGTPVANAGPDQTATVPHDGDPNTNTVGFTLDGSASSDPDGDGITYQWLDENGNPIAGGGQAKIDLVRQAGEHVFTLRVTDSYGASASATVKVTVLAEPNGTPTANAGPDQKFTSSTGVNVALNGSGSSDPDNDALQYVWTEGGQQIATGVSPVVFFAIGVHTVTLTVTDPYGASSSDTVVITVSVPTSNLHLTSLGKTFATVGSFPPTFIVNGSGFKKGAVLTWNGTPMPTTFLSTTQLRTKLTAEQIAVAGVFQVGVVNPDGGASNTLPFTVNNPVAYLAALDPASVVHGSPTFTLQVIGDRFVPGTVFLWKGQPRPTVYVSPTLLLVTIYDTDVAVARGVTVRVTSPGPGGGNSNARTFYVLP